jgi:TRAP-type C4-dicarboxylate transport system permease small subunit
MKRFDQAFGRILEACGAISAFLVLVVTAIITLNVVLRNAFGARMAGDVDASEYAMLLITAFASPWLLRKGQHVRIDLMLHKLPSLAGWMCELFVDALGFVVSVLMTWYATKVFFVSVSDGTKLVKEFTIPEWWVLWPLPVMFALVAVEFVFRFRRILSGSRRPRSEGAAI